MSDKPQCPCGKCHCIICGNPMSSDAYENLKAKLAEVEAELDNKRGAMMLEIKRLHELADREREAVKSLTDQLKWSLKNEDQYKNELKKALEAYRVMREALIHLDGELDTGGDCMLCAYDGHINKKHEEGCLWIFLKNALAKADEILKNPASHP